jgi:hypothetical protein
VLSDTHREKAVAAKKKLIQQYKLNMRGKTFNPMLFIHCIAQSAKHKKNSHQVN